MGPVPDLPIHAGVIQAPVLGVALEAWDDDGKRSSDGEGDLVVTKPYPMMPLGFLGDDSAQTRFKDAYFNHYPHTTVWYHADHSEFISAMISTERDSRFAPVFIDSTGGINVLGRSDGVLNPQGVRFGSSEIYSVVEAMKDE